MKLYFSDIVLDIVRVEKIRNAKKQSQSASFSKEEILQRISKESIDDFLNEFQVFNRYIKVSLRKDQEIFVIYSRLFKNILAKIYFDSLTKVRLKAFVFIIATRKERNRNRRQVNASDRFIINNARAII